MKVHLKFQQNDAHQKNCAADHEHYFGTVEIYVQKQRKSYAKVDVFRYFRNTTIFRDLEYIPLQENIRKGSQENAYSFCVTF